MLDFGDVIVNVMTPRSREYYDIEAFWKNGQFLDLSGVLLPNQPGGSVAAAGFLSEDEADPFWGAGGVADGDLALELTAEELDVAANGVGREDDGDDDGDATDDPFWDLASEGATLKAEEDPFWS